MQEQKKIYPSGHAPAKWLSWFVTLLTVVVVLSGLFTRSHTDTVIQPVATATPLPLEESFDETMDSCEWSLPEADWYALQLGAFDSEDSALALAEQFRMRGAAGYLWHQDRYRVLAAIYPTEEDARAVRTQISQQHGVDSYLCRITLPGVQVSMQGMRGQIEILQAGFLHAADLVAQLQACSLLADHSGADTAELLATLKAASEQTSLVAARIRQRFPEPRNACADGLLRLLEGFGSFCAGLDEGAQTVLFGSELKYQSILSLDLLRQVYDTLGNT